MIACPARAALTGGARALHFRYPNERTVQESRHPEIPSPPDPERLRVRKGE